jgi:hypothetical protein
MAFIAVVAVALAFTEDDDFWNQHYQRKQTHAIEEQTRAIEDLQRSIERSQRYPSRGPLPPLPPAEVERRAKLLGTTPLPGYKERYEAYYGEPASGSGWVVPIIAGAIGAGVVIGAYFLAQRLSNKPLTNSGGVADGGEHLQAQDRRD